MTEFPSAKFRLTKQEIKEPFFPCFLNFSEAARYFTQALSVITFVFERKKDFFIDNTYMMQISLV